MTNYHKIRLLLIFLALIKASQACAEALPDLDDNLNLLAAEVAVQGYEPKPYDNISQPDMEMGNVPATAQSGGVDERPLWELLKAKKFSQLNQKINQLKQKHPDWEPSVDLITSAAQEGKTIKKKSSAEAVINAAQRKPDEFSCDKVHNMWALGDAYHVTGNQAELEKLYQKIVNKCPDAAKRLITLQRASQQLPVSTTDALLQEESKKTLPETERQQLDDFAYGFNSKRLADANRRKADLDAQQPVQYLESEIRKRQDVNMANFMGWRLVDRKNYSEGMQWFSEALTWQPNAKSAYGYAYALKKSGRKQEAEDVMRQWRKDPAMAKMLAESQPRPARVKPTIDPALQRYNRLQSDAVKAYTGGRYRSALGNAQEALQSKYLTTKSRGGMRNIKAWSLYHLQDFRSASQEFESLYRYYPAMESGKGLMLSALKANDISRLQNVIAETKGPLDMLEAPSAPQDPKLVGVYYQYNSQLINSVYEAKDYPKAVEYSQRIDDQIIAKNDAGLARLVGWSHLLSHDPKTAKDWFERSLAWNPSPETAEGLIYALRDDGQLEAAEKLAQQWEGQSANLKNIRAEMLLTRAYESYKRGEVEQSFKLASESNKVNPDRKAQMLMAWSQYKQGNTSAAQTAFTELYRADPEQESGFGLYTSAIANGTEEEVIASLGERGGQIQRKLKEHLARQAYFRNLFIYADQLRGDSFPQLENISSTDIAAQPYGRHRTGQEGLGQLDAYGVQLQARSGFGRHRLAFDLDLFHVDSGQLNPFALVGNRPFPEVPGLVNQNECESLSQRLGNIVNVSNYDSLCEESILIEPRLSYRYEGNLSPYFAIGSSPLNGQVGALPTGKLGLEWLHGSGGMNAEFYADSIQQSILSISGLRDPYTGAEWGRVIEYGVRGGLWQQIKGPWSIALNAQYGHLFGKNVAGNDHVSALIGLGYGFDVPGFKYFILGPNYQYQHFSDNLRFFTFGHGGYFSPNHFHMVGPQLRFQTEEGQKFVVRGDMFLGYQNTDEADTRRLPLTGQGGLIRGTDNSGISFVSNIEGVYRLADNWQIGGNIGVIQSDNFTDLGGGVMLRYVFDSRPAVFSTDLPWRSGYQY